MEEKELINSLENCLHNCLKNHLDNKEFKISQFEDEGPFSFEKGLYMMFKNQERFRVTVRKLSKEEIYEDDDW